MNISINNQIGAPNKYIRLALWKLFRLEKKFSNLKSSTLNILRVSPKSADYRVTLKLETAMDSIVLRQRSSSISKIITALDRDAHRYLHDQKKVMQLYKTTT